METREGGLGRREWLARLGVTAVGMGGALLAWRRGGMVGAVTTPVAAQDEAHALRVNLGFVSAYVLVRPSGLAIIDTGIANSEDQIGAVIATAGRGWEDVKHVILTHWHQDHSGSAVAVLDRAVNATIWVGEADVERVSIPKPISPATDSMEIFGMQVIQTPGHTAGHISMYEPAMGLLFVGDAVVNMGSLQNTPPQFTADMDAAKASVAKIAAIDGFQNAMFGHGDPIEGGAQALFAQLAQSLG